MTRTLTTAVATAASAVTGEICHLLSLEFSGGTVRLTTASRDISWNAQTWSSVGGALTFEAVRETPDLAGQSVKVMLDGVSQVAIAAFLAEGYIGRLATLYLVHLDSSGNVIADPLILFLGYMNTAWNVDEHVDPSGGWARVSTSIVSPLARFNQKRGIRADLVSHQRHYSTDTFMSHIAAIPDGDIGWGIYTGIIFPWSNL